MKITKDYIFLIILVIAVVVLSSYSGRTAPGTFTYKAEEICNTAKVDMESNGYECGACQCCTKSFKEWYTLCDKVGDVEDPTITIPSTANRCGNNPVDICFKTAMPKTVNQGEDLSFEVFAENNKETSDEFYIECGMYSSIDIKSWYPDTMAVNRQDIVGPSVKEVSNCRTDETNVDTKQVFLPAQSSVVVPFKIQTLKTAEESSYVIHCQAFKKCYNELTAPEKTSPNPIGQLDKEIVEINLVGDLRETGCLNGVMDGTETGVDCGGSCGKCDAKLPKFNLGGINLLWVGLLIFMFLVFLIMKKKKP